MLLRVAASALLLSLAVVSGLYGQEAMAEEAVAPSTSELEESALHTFAVGALPLRPSRVMLRSEPIFHARGAAEEVAYHTAIATGSLVFPAGGEISLTEAASPDTSYANIDSLASRLLNAELIRPGYWLADVLWLHTTEADSSVRTLAVLDRDGSPVYEPILYLHTHDVHSEFKVNRGSWQIHWQHAVKNGFRMTCAGVEAVVRVETAGPRIADPAPHISVTRLPTCPLWDSEVTKGEIDWCMPNEHVTSGCGDETTGRDRAPGEQCIKWVVQYQIGSGLANVKLKGKVGAAVKGIPVEGVLSADVRGGLGWTSHYERIGSLCAMTGAH